MLGTLTVVGTGVDARRHITAEGAAAIRTAEQVCACMGDEASLYLIKSLNPNVIDLMQLYSEAVPRFVTYARITDAVVDSVVSGTHVCLVFYGHPGVCVTAANEAMRRVRSLGGVAVMLPAVSSHDALFAQLAIDPGLSGCQIFEATNYLTRRRQYDTTTPLVLYQIAAVGDANYYKNGFPGVCLPLLIDTLVQRYGGPHECVLYRASVSPSTDPDELITFTLSAPPYHVISVGHTLFVPARAIPEKDEEMISTLRRIRQEFYTATNRPLPADWSEYSSYNRSE